MSLSDACKRTYVTLVDDFYFPGVVALKNSMNCVGAGPLVCLCLPMKPSSKAYLEGMGIKCIDCDLIANPSDSCQSRFSKIYSKLNVFKLEQYEKIVFIDADIIVLNSIDDLFEIDADFAAAPDHGISRHNSRFNSGLFLLKPSIKLFNDMLGKLSSIDSYDKSDQGFLNEYFKDNWVSLDPSYNTLKRVYESEPERFERESIKAIHYVGTKPWELNSEDYGKYRALNRLWCSYCTTEILVEHLLDSLGGEGELNGMLKNSELAALSKKNAQLLERVKKLQDETVRLRSCKKYKIGKCILFPYERSLDYYRSIKRRFLKKKVKSNKTKFIEPQITWQPKSKAAFFSSLDESYVLGFQVLLSSMLRHNAWFDLDFIVMDMGLSQSSKDKIMRMYSNIRFIHPRVENYKHINMVNVPRNFRKNYYKLDAFSYSAYDRIVSIDTDMLVLGDISHLLSIQCDLGVVAAYNEQDDQIFKDGYFNGGLIIIDKKWLGYETYSSILYEATPGHIKAEQDLLNEVFRDSATFLPKAYNCEKRIQKNGNLSEIYRNVRILHYVGLKPWSEDRDGEFEEIEKLWWDEYEKAGFSRQ